MTSSSVGAPQELATAAQPGQRQGRVRAAAAYLGIVRLYLAWAPPDRILQENAKLPEEERSVRHDVVEVDVAVGVAERRSRAAPHEEGLTADGGEGPDGGIDAAGEERLRFGEEVVLAVLGRESPSEEAAVEDTCRDDGNASLDAQR